MDSELRTKSGEEPAEELLAKRHNYPAMGGLLSQTPSSNGVGAQTESMNGDIRSHAAASIGAVSSD